jgi:hypothetical protein
MNYDSKENRAPCTECLLTQFVPADEQGEKVLCRHIPLIAEEFFLPAMRRKFQFSLTQLQNELDTFVDTYNAMQLKREYDLTSAPHPPANFPVDL